MPCAKPKRVYFNPCIIQAVQGRSNNPITGVKVNKRPGRTDWQGVDNIGSTLGKTPQKVISAFFVVGPLRFGYPPT